MRIEVDMLGRRKRRREARGHTLLGSVLVFLSIFSLPYEYHIQSWLSFWGYVALGLLGVNYLALGWWIRREEA
jgi:hypothetical protein